MPIAGDLARFRTKEPVMAVTRRGLTQAARAAAVVVGGLAGALVLTGGYLAMFSVEVVALPVR